MSYELIFLVNQQLFHFYTDWKYLLNDKIYNSLLYIIGENN